MLVIQIAVGIVLGFIALQFLTYLFETGKLKLIFQMVLYLIGIIFLLYIKFTNNTDLINVVGYGFWILVGIGLLTLVFAVIKDTCLNWQNTKLPEKVEEDRELTEAEIEKVMKDEILPLLDKKTPWWNNILRKENEK